MNISFYVNNEEKTEITSFYDMVSTPFNKGDIIRFDVIELPHTYLKSYPESFIENVIQKNKTLSDNFNRTDFQIIEERKYIRFNGLNESQLTIEYYCQRLTTLANK